MKVTEHLTKAAGKTLFSFEVLPPRKGETIDNLFRNIEPLLEFKPPFIDVTYHREEFVLRERPGGGFVRRAVRKRPGTVAICAAIKNRFDVDTVPHLICGGFSQEVQVNQGVFGFLAREAAADEVGHGVHVEAVFDGRADAHRAGPFPHGFLVEQPARPVPEHDFLAVVSNVDEGRLEFE